MQHSLRILLHFSAGSGFLRSRWRNRVYLLLWLNGRLLLLDWLRRSHRLLFFYLGRQVFPVVALANHANLIHCLTSHQGYVAIIACRAKHGPAFKQKLSLKRYKKWALPFCLRHYSLVSFFLQVSIKALPFLY